MLQRYISSVFVLLIVFFASPLTARATEQEAGSFAQSIGDRVLVVLAAQEPDVTKQTNLEALFVKVVDTDWIARFVLGAPWRKMNEAAQQEYLAAYRAFLVKHYTSNFKEYTKGTSFKIARTRPIGSDGQYLVTVALIRAQGEPVNLSYRLRQEAPQQFRVIDIVVEGVSLLATQRSEFASVIQREGVGYLVALLKKKST